MDVEEFKKSVKKVSESRTYKVTNSYGGHDAYKWYRENIQQDPKVAVTLVNYLKIIRSVNDRLRELLANGTEIVLPCGMGMLELKKVQYYYDVSGGKVKTNIMIDWDKTLDLWAEDEECFEKKQLVRFTNKYRFKILYNKENAKFNNKSYYHFSVNRGLKKRLKENIRDNKIDAFIEEKYYD